MSLEESLDVIRESDLSVLLMTVGFNMTQVQVLKSGRRVEVDQVGNVYCPTGKGGGIDPTCSPKNQVIVEGLRWYKYHGYQSINKGLRTGKLSKSADKTVQKIDELFQPSDKDIKVYRGIKWGKTGETVKKLQSMKEGDEFHDAGYVSTSFDKSVARKFAKNHNIVVEYEVPKGFPIIEVDSVLGSSNRENEREVLLPRKSTWIVKSIHPVEDAVGLRITMRPKKGKQSGLKTYSL